MTLPTVKHPLVSALSDGPDNTLVQPSDWNADHEMLYAALPFYDEGTWTPVLSAATPGTMAITYSVQTGVWTRVGRLVHIQFRILISTFTLGTASGQLRVTGLPFTVGTTHGPIAGSHNGVDMGGSAHGAMCEPNTTYIRFLGSTDNGAWADAAPSGVSNGDDFIFGGQYVAVVP